MRKIILCLSLFLMACLGPAFAVKIKRPVTNNYNRGRIAFQNGDVWAALLYLEQELKDNPDNGYALFWLALVHESQGSYERALTEIDSAIKKIPSRDKSYQSMADVIRLEIYREVEIWRWLQSLHVYAR